MKSHVYLTHNDTYWIAGAAAVAGSAMWLLARSQRPTMADMPMRTFERFSDAAGGAAETLRRSPRTSLGGVAALAGIALLLASRRHRDQAHDEHADTEAMIEVNVPVRTAYNQWTQFEEFPRFMATVEQVRQIDDSHLHWRAVVAGKTKEWESEITEQIPDQKIAWRSTTGVRNWGEVTFDKVAENRTRIRLRMHYEPEDAQERIGSALGGVKLTAKGNLQKFKQLIEARGAETGGWRGEIPEQR